MKISKSSSLEHESNTCESEGAQKRQLKKLTNNRETIATKSERMLMEVRTDYQYRLNMAQELPW